MRPRLSAGVRPHAGQELDCKLKQGMGLLEGGAPLAGTARESLAGLAQVRKDLVAPSSKRWAGRCREGWSVGKELREIGRLWRHTLAGTKRRRSAWIRWSFEAAPNNALQRSGASLTPLHPAIHSVQAPAAERLPLGSPHLL